MLSAHAQIDSEILVCLVTVKNLFKVCVCSLKTLILKIAPEAAPNFILASLSLIGRFSLAYSIHGRGLEQFSGSEAAFRTTFRVTGGYRKAGTSSVRRVTFLTLSL